MDKSFSRVACGGCGTWIVANFPFVIKNLGMPMLSLSWTRQAEYKSFHEPDALKKFRPKLTITLAMDLRFAEMKQSLPAVALCWIRSDSKFYTLLNHN